MDTVDIAVPVGVRRTFAYSVPASLRGRIAPGMRVLVPFGRKMLTGYVIGPLSREDTGHLKLRPVNRLLDSEPAIPSGLVEIALWVARYYFAPPGEVLRALFPAGTQVAGDRRISLAPEAARLLNGGLRPPGLRSQQELILEILAREGPLPFKELAERSALRNMEAWIDSLADAGLITIDTIVDSPKVRTKEQLSIRSLPGQPELIESLPETQRRLYELTSGQTSPLPLQEALRLSKCTVSVARALERKGLAVIAAEQVHRTPLELAAASAGTPVILTPAQQEIVDGILNLIVVRKPARCLLHGVTGSGKTEVYLRLIAEVLKLGGTALFLVPEIGLTPMLSRLVVSRFPGLVSLMHSGMSPGERYDQWSRIRDGASRVVVGTRSAVFAPLNDLRIIVIDEEQDSSYKQDESPCYHAREVAWQRVQQSNGILLMGSATPSIETFYSAHSIGDTNLFLLPERVESKPMPQVTIVDMAKEFERKGKNVVVSSVLEDELRHCVGRGEQAIILLNRRGYSRTLLCRSCGHVFTCPECSVSMTYHQQENRLACHYCGQERSTPSTCAGCGGPYIHYAGVGTEQLESILRGLIPNARIARLDRDTTRRRGFLRSTLFSFAERRLDILVGTQMLAKGHDFPDVTMVGVVAADSGLSFPDFRSAERTFQLLTQVAGRAGRGTQPGRVVIQSYHPESYALQSSQKQDYEAFYEKEIEFRKTMGYPPFRSLIQILVTDPDETQALRAAETIASTLKTHASRLDPVVRPRVLGPAAAPLEKLRGNYRMQVLVKLAPGAGGISMLQDCFDELERRKGSSAKVHIDVDPLSLL
ncbi:MAG: primosomal protein N' [Acidobacteria bacterium]|nr:primosomal protein N' [Acidobacteriota bacterium]